MVGKTHLAVVLERKIEGETNDTLRLRTRGHLQALDDTGIALVLKARVFTLRVLTDDGEVYVVVTSGEARERLAKNDRRVDVKLLAHGDVPRDVARLGDGGEEDTWESESWSHT